MAPPQNLAHRFRERFARQRASACLVALVLVVAPCCGEGAEDEGAAATNDPGNGGAPSVGPAPPDSSDPSVSPNTPAGGTPNLPGETAGAPSIGNGGAPASSDVARGAISLEVAAASGCSLMSMTFNFPEVASGRSVSDAEVASTVEDGQVLTETSAARVSCFWSGEAPPYDVRGNIQIGPAGDLLSTEVHADLAPGQSDEGEVVLAGSELAGTYIGDCTFSTIELDADARSFWGSFVCSRLATIDGGDVCSVGTSYVYFENCEAQ